MNDISRKIEKIDEEKVSRTNAMNLKEISLELEKLSTRGHMARAEQLRILSKVLQEKAREMELAKKAEVKDIVKEIIDAGIVQIGKRTCIQPFSPELRNEIDYLIRGNAVSSARSIGAVTAEKIVESALKIAKYEGKDVDEVHISLAVKLLVKRLYMAKVESEVTG